MNILNEISTIGDYASSERSRERSVGGVGELIINYYFI